MTTDSLATPFDASLVQWRAGKVSGNQTLGMAYVDARAVMARLDDAFGAEGWQDTYYVVDAAGGAVQCTISALYPDPNWDATTNQPLRYTTVNRSDVGYPNGLNDVEPLKGAYSDAFKRAAVKFGIGRDLYEIEPMWLPYDAEKKRITAFPEYVVGKGWVQPAPDVGMVDRIEAARARAASPLAPVTLTGAGTRSAAHAAKTDSPLATDAMRRKVFAAATAKSKDHVALKAIAQAVVGKDSSKLWTVSDVDKLLGFIGDLAVDPPGSADPREEDDIH